MAQALSLNTGPFTTFIVCIFSKLVVSGIIHWKDRKQLPVSQSQSPSSGCLARGWRTPAFKIADLIFSEK
jgi:hypothetical protein